MNKNKLSIYFAFIAILSFLTFFISIVQKSYFNLVNPVKEVGANKLLTPISPSLNLEIINDIETRPENIDDSLENFSLEKALATISGQQSKE